MEFERLEYTLVERLADGHIFVVDTLDTLKFYCKYPCWFTVLRT